MVQVRRGKGERATGTRDLGTCRLGWRWLAVVGASVVILGLGARPLRSQGITLSEIRIDQSGADTDEFFELAGPAGASLDGLTYLVLGDSSAGGSGVIEEVTDLTGFVIPASGYFVAAEASFSLGIADLTTDLNFENGENVTHLLVRGFSGTNGQDLDTDDDGTLDLTPWTELVDLVALVKEDNPPVIADNEYHYGPPVVGPVLDAVPGLAHKCPAAGWQVGCLDARVDESPGAEGDCCLSVGCYYEGVVTSPAAIRSTVHAAIQDHCRTSFGSDESWGIVGMANEDPDDPTSILDVYRNESYPQVVGGGGNYHLEHTWPQSYGFPKDTGSGRYPRSDLHAIFPADASYNESRSNLPYDTCDPGCTGKPTAPNHGQGGNGGGYPGDSNWRTGAGTTGTWEVWSGLLGGRRGDVARAILYMDVRYDGSDHKDGTDEPELEVTDDRGDLFSDSDNPQDPAFMGMLSTLLEWHQQDPVDDLEVWRQEVLFAFQGNRNPFVDHPEWVDCVYLDDCPGVDLTVVKDDGWPDAVAGETVTYEIAVGNTGPDGVTGAVVTDVFDPDRFDVGAITWTCEPVAGAGPGTTCPANGSAAELEAGVAVDIEAGDAVAFTVDCPVLASATGTLVNTATVAAPEGTSEHEPASNSDTDSNDLPALGACGEPEDRVLTNTTVTTTVVAEACTSITASSGFRVEAPGDLTLRAGERIVLGDGFSVGPGGRFVAEIDEGLSP